MVGSEVHSSEVKKTKVLMENLRRAIGSSVKENKEVYEGESVMLYTLKQIVEQFKGWEGLRSDTSATEFDLEVEEYVPLPKGEVYKKKEIVQVVNRYIDGVAELVSGILFIDEVFLS
ncbi:ruvB 1 [Olea europaea subsp. europaea]|uniref:RuvB-like helicase n=1 Tax=Olea europaea subsp. europaea TaxID=158383 RepID=A0A8S0T0K4_OLEEU|nr:ruvB 1 [Olea europaea subsp. europaea]